MKRRLIVVAAGVALLLSAVVGGIVLILRPPSSTSDVDTTYHPFRVPWRVIASGGQGQGAWQLEAGVDGWGRLCLGLRNARSTADRNADVRGCGFNAQGAPTQYWLDGMLGDAAYTPVVFGPLPSGAAGVRITWPGHPDLRATAQTLPEGLPKGKFWIRVMPQTFSLGGDWSAQAINVTGSVIPFQDY